jgi:UDP-glucose 4-epimerase
MDVEAEGRTVAVTGACGFVGTEVLRRLEEDRRFGKALALDIRKPELGPEPRKTRFFKIDLTLPSTDADLAALFRRENVDTLVHAAFLSSPTHQIAWAHELEDIGTMHVLNACAEVGMRRLVLSSTTLVYGPHPSNPNFLTEEHELRAVRDAFLADKVAAEKQVARFAREHEGRSVVTVLRLAPILGPTVQGLAARFFSRPILPRLMGYDPLVQLLHEADVGRAFAAALSGDHAGAFNIVGEGLLPYSTVLAMMGKLPVPLPGFVAAPLMRALWATQLADAPPTMLAFLKYLCVADGDRARRVLGFRPRHDIRGIIQDFLGDHAAAEVAS